ncbi:MAG: hypothetical protein DCF17_09550 [Shackletoniella antarctica]|uniref:TIR domain-containing protein n=1 Tax=Shackletoniella antarctica TaxID=268115 RepID=A0A2W4Y4W0_9CYAN|nr:MAG: hypothetical protein DCF17_09550 [Shackletoniella antarctica]
MSFIFISYSRQDQAYVSLLAQALESHRLPFWLDINTDYGDTWPHTIEKQVECCQVLFIVMSPRSKQSHWVQCELAHALELRKPIFPLLLEGPRWFSVAALQTVDVTGGSLPPDRFFDTLRPYFPAPTATAESTLIQEVAADAIPSAPVGWAPPTDRFNSSPQTDVTNLSELWKDIISVLEPLGTRALMQQQGTLVKLTENVAQVVVDSKPLLKMAQGRVENVEQAFKKILGCQVKVDVLCRTDLAELWGKVILALEPQGTRALMQQQGNLLFFNGNTAWVEISSRLLLRMAKNRVPHVESAFKEVLGHEVKVHIEEYPESN